MYENVHPNLALVLLFKRTEEERGKGLLVLVKIAFVEVCFWISAKISNESY